MLRRLISYSLYGNDPKYTVGAIENSRLAKAFYSDWQIRMYIGDSVPASVINQLSNAGVQVVRIAGREGPSAMFWRFRALFDGTADVVIVRDSDSRPSLREACAVRDWLASGLAFHIMRDHPYHCTPILGGLWGVRTRSIRSAASSFENYHINGYYGEDQKFLNRILYPLSHGNAVIHDEIQCIDRDAVPFPTARSGYEFVGEVIDAHGLPVQSDRAALQLYYEDRWFRYRTVMRGAVRGMIWRYRNSRGLVGGAL